MCNTTLSGGTAVQHKDRLDILSLEEDVQTIFEHSLATTTKGTYRAGVKKFNQFCVLHHITNPLPASQHLLCLFASYLANCGLSHGTIKTYMSAVHFWHLANDYEPPRVGDMPKLKLVEKGSGKQAGQRPRLEGGSQSPLAYSSSSKQCGLQSKSIIERHFCGRH